MMPFNNRNGHMNQVHGNGAVIPNGPPPVPQHCLPSAVVTHPQIVQNGYVGIPQNANQTLPLPQHGPISNMAQNINQIPFMQPQGQFLLPNYPQNINQILLGGCLHSQNLNQNVHLQSLGQFGAHGLGQNLTPAMGLANGQFILQNQMQNINQIAAGHHMQHTLGHSHTTSFNTNPNTQPQFACLNQIPHVPGSQNPNFFANPHLAMANSIVNPNNLAVSNKPIKYNNQDPNIFSLSAMGQSTMQESSVGALQLGGSLLPSLAVGPAQIPLPENIQPGRSNKQQGNDGGNNKASYISQGNATKKNFDRNIHGRRRFQKSHFHKMSNDKGKFMQTTSNRGKGNWHRGAGKPQQANLNRTTRMEFHRSLSLTYTEEEIRQWREERRKNFPSKANIEKKVAGRSENGDISNATAKRRRQQLKEILTKQAELGVEVAEIPPYYLSDTENQDSKRENLKMESNRKGRFRNKYDKKRGHHGQHNAFAKKQKLEGDEPPQPSIAKKTTTLLEKLLSADIKRDKSHLLQVFRFMVTNSFLRSWPEKPLEFPQITVKDAGVGEGFAKCQGSQLEKNNEDSDSSNDDDNAGGSGGGVDQEGSREEMVNEYVDGKKSGEGIEKSDAEEGEITE